MTLYQAKGLEFPIVFVPQLLKDEWPAREYGSGLFPKDLLRESIPAGDIHTEEERRLLYVALTRARDRLVVTTHGGPAAKKDPSPFVDELLAEAGDEIRASRSGGGRAASGRAGAGRRPARRDAPDHAHPDGARGPAGAAAPGGRAARDARGDGRGRSGGSRLRGLR